MDSVEAFCQLHGAKVVPSDFSYNSGTNPQFLTVGEIRKLITENLDDSFKPI